jgi:hypothetical protein
LSLEICCGGSQFWVFCKKCFVCGEEESGRRKKQNRRLFISVRLRKEYSGEFEGVPSIFNVP